MELKDTVELMNSSDYKKRFLAEYLQVKIRYDKLCEVLEKYKVGGLNFTPTCSYDLLKEQTVRMKSYIDMLKIRAEKEGIDLKEGK